MNPPTFPDYLASSPKAGKQRSPNLIDYKYLTFWLWWVKHRDNT